MSTGYTEQLKNMKFDTKTWLLQAIPRAFGCLVQFREDPMDLTPDQLLAGLEEKSDSNDYHQRQLIDSKKAYESKLAWSDSKWKEAFEENKRKEQEYHDKLERERAELMDGYMKSLNEVKSIAKEVPSEFETLLSFAQEQIKDTIAFDCTYYDPRSKLKTAEEFKTAILEDLKQSISYHEDKIAQQKEGNKERINFYKRWISLVNNHFKGGVNE